MASWRRTLKTLIEAGQFRTQGELVHALAGAGHSISQGTVSRELSRMGVRKVEGIYQVSPGAPGAPVFRAQLAHGGGLMVLHTLPAHASVLAQQVDDLSLDAVIGTIAGDDTVFVALSSAGGGVELLDSLGVIRPQES